MLFLTAAAEAAAGAAAETAPLLLCVVARLQTGVAASSERAERFATMTTMTQEVTVMTAAVEVAQLPLVVMRELLNRSRRWRRAAKRRHSPER